MSWVDSLSTETLTRLNQGAYVAGLVFTIGLAICTLGVGLSIVLGHCTSNRLMARRETADDQARELHADAERALQAELESSRQEAELAKHESAGLREHVRPRDLTEDQAAPFLAALAAAPKGTIRIEHVVADPESEHLADRITQLLRQAGWTTTRSAGIYTVAPVGLYLVVSDQDEELPPPAVALQRALDSAGLRAPTQVDVSSPVPLALLIGRRPS